MSTVEIKTKNSENYEIYKMKVDDIFALYKKNIISNAEDLREDFIDYETGEIDLYLRFLPGLEANYSFENWSNSKLEIEDYRKIMTVYHNYHKARDVDTRNMYMFNEKHNILYIETLLVDENEIDDELIDNIKEEFKDPSVEWKYFYKHVDTVMDYIDEFVDNFLSNVYAMAVINLSDKLKEIAELDDVRGGLNDIETSYIESK